MIEQKPRVLIGLSSAIYFRNLVETHAFDALAERCAVFWFMTDTVRRTLPSLPGVTDVGRCTTTRWRETIRYHLRWVAVFAGHRRCNTLAVKRRYAITSRRERWPYLVLSLPGVWPVVESMVEACMGPNRSIERIVDRVRPDVVVFPSQGNDSFTVDLLRSTRARRIPAVMLNYNFDNMGSKGPMRLKPDCLCVWGEDMARLAHQVHRLPPERIRVIGAAHFEQYLDPVRLSRAAQEGAALAGGMPRLLFAGNSRGHAETKYLLALEEAIQAGRLPRVKVIYRPHPWRAPRPNEKSFYEYGFRHVEMDPQLAQQFGRDMNVASKPVDRTFAPPMDYNARLLYSVKGVITPFSTLALEAALVGVAVLGMNCFDEPWLRYALSHFEHLQRIQRIPGVEICHDEARFIEHVARLLERSRDDTLPTRMRDAVRPIVYSDGRTTYAQRLADVVQELLGGRDTVVAKSRPQAVEAVPAGVPVG